MGFFSKFEGRVEDTFEGAANKMFDAPISPVQIAKKAEKQMRREKVVGAGKQIAPTLYTILVNHDDDQRLFGYYPTLAGETETYLAAKAAEEGLHMDGQPLVRFIADDALKHGKFEVIAELVSAPIIAQLREEEMQRYGIGGAPAYNQVPAAGGPQAPDNRYQQQDPYAPQGGYGQPDPYVPQGGYGQPDPYVPQGGYGQADPYAPLAQDFYDQADPHIQGYDFDGYDEFGNPYTPQSASGKPPLPYVPEDEIDYSIDYGEYTFNSQDFDDYRENGVSGTPLPFASDPEYDQNDYYAYDTRESRNSGAFAGDRRNSVPFASQPRTSDPFPNQPHTAAPYTEQPRTPAPFPGNAAGVAGGAVASAAGAAGGIPSGIPNAAGGRRGPAGNMPSGMPMGAPNTVVFAPGGGNANPMAGNAPIRARLINITTSRAYDLAATRYIIGRESTNDIVVDDINASRTHAELRYEPQGVWVLADLGSTNGTLVNGIEIVAQPLHEGDRISIGMTNFMFTMQ